jgi:hypothetical protein
MYKFLFSIFVLGIVGISLSQNYPYYAQPQGYLMNDGVVQQQQNINSISNWWGAKPGRITDTCPITITTKYGDSLWCYALGNYSGTDKIVGFTGFNNKTDTVFVTVPAGGTTNKLPRVWRIMSTTNTSSTMDSMSLWFQNGKKNPNNL